MSIHPSIHPSIHLSLSFSIDSISSFLHPCVSGVSRKALHFFFPCTPIHWWPAFLSFAHPPHASPPVLKRLAALACSCEIHGDIILQVPRDSCSSTFSGLFVRSTKDPCQVLQRLVARTEAKMVLTSHWRRHKAEWPVCQILTGAKKACRRMESPTLLQECCKPDCDSSHVSLSTNCVSDHVLRCSCLLLSILMFLLTGICHRGSWQLWRGAEAGGGCYPFQC